ncbi:MAG: ATP-dependent DNA helicase, partial [Smithellaceae bacterium]|nr:ATP-dependent DNA helicase [Smithellaceae bacterium]
TYNRGGRPPHFGEIIRVLEHFNLLPAIFFLKSRSECDGAIKTCRCEEERIENDDFHYSLDEQLERFPYLKNHKQLYHLEKARVAAHHAGQLPAWKFLVEAMMKKGHLKAIFATSTVAAGVNYPARTIVMFNSDLYNGHDFLPLSGIEFHQMTGRAGRRGQDKIGFMLAIPGRFMDLVHVKRLLFSKPEGVESRIRNDFSMVLNLLLSQTPDDIKGIFSRSLAAYQLKESGQSGSEIKLWEDFQRHLNFLREEGFVDEYDRPTENGLWASKLRLDQPLLIAECLKQQVLPLDDEQLLAATIAPFVYDGDLEIKIDRKRVPRKLIEAGGNIAKALRGLMRRMQAAGFPVNPIYMWTSVVIYNWARGADWDEMVKSLGMADGDMAMLILRTADNLRQLMSLKDTHPEIAEQAFHARAALLREPVVFE